MAATATKLLTAREFALRPEPPDGSREELVRGEVVTMPPPSFPYGEVAAQIGFLLKTFVHGKNLGRVVGETGVRTEHDPDSVRGPDVSYWSYERLPRQQSIDVYPEVAADLCVEVRSPSNSLRELRDRAAEYFVAGVRMVWVIDPEDQSVTVFRKRGRGVTLWGDELLDGEEVLPGFSSPVSSLFEI
jgi:Uma2 family endonuclease